MATETDIMRQMRVTASKLGARLFRNHVGLSYTKDGRPMRHGLGNGTSDLIGLIPVEVTPDMVGKKVGIFFAVEVKKPKVYTKKKHLEEQVHFLEFVCQNGGVGVMCDSTTAVEEIINNYKRGNNEL
ncbi:hypothetical protein EBZ39_10845 [bacterium]|nr:hypothetical protein [bacterium]